MNKTTLLLLFLFYACNEQGQNKVSSAFSADLATIVIKSTSTILKNPSGDSIENFVTFWQTFRNAVIKSDTAQIRSLSSFPIRYRGPFDEDPILKISADHFSKLFHIFLKQWHGDLEGSTELDYIKKINSPTEQPVNGEVRIGNMVFLQKKGKWKLSFLYLNEETIEFLNKQKKR